MSRITVIQGGRTMRVSAPQAALMIEGGAKLDPTDRRGSEAYERYMHNRERPKKKRTASKTKEPTDAG